MWIKIKYAMWIIGLPVPERERVSHTKKRQQFRLNLGGRKGDGERFCVPSRDLYSWRYQSPRRRVLATRRTDVAWRVGERGGKHSDRDQKRDSSRNNSCEKAGSDCLMLRQLHPELEGGGGPLLHLRKVKWTVKLNWRLMSRV